MRRRQPQLLASAITDNALACGIPRRSGKGLDTPIESGPSDGVGATWKAKVKKPMAVTLDSNFTLSGNELKGTVKNGVFGSGALTRTRQ
jgi:hypothetical protein